MSRSASLNSSTENLSSAEKEIERVLRPSVFSEFMGQPLIVDNLKVFIKAAKQRGEAQIGRAHVWTPVTL